MKTESNWKYSDLNFNLFNVEIDDKEKEELLELIDKSKKKELADTFEKGLNFGFEAYKKYLFESSLFLFRGLEYNIKESTYCLIIGAKTASITNTNLILERALKLGLIQYDADHLIDFQSEESVNKYIICDRKYSGKNIDQNIQICLKFGILTKNEADELRKYKLKFRDGFSHFTPKNILRGEKSLINVPGGKIDSKLQLEFKTPTYQAAEVRQFAHNEAEKHLIYVLKIINHLQYKILEKFKQK